MDLCLIIGLIGRPDSAEFQHPTSSAVDIVVLCKDTHQTLLGQFLVLYMQAS